MQPSQVVIGQNTRQRDERERGPLERRVYSIDVTNVTNSQITLLTVPDDRYFQITDFGVCNIAGATIAVTVYRVPDGGSAGSTNKLYDAHSMATNVSETLTAAVGGTLNPGDFIVVETDHATGANFWITGVVYVGGLPDV